MAFLRRNTPAKPTPPPVSVASTPRDRVALKPEGRTAPEPLTLVLPAFAALGAVASIAAVAYVAQDRQGERPRVKRRVDVILRDLDTSCLGIAEILRRVKRNARVLGLDGASGHVAMKLGLNSGRLEHAGGDIYHAMVNDLATMLVLATQNSFDAINAIEDGEISASEAVLSGFGQAQEKLNRLFLARASLRQMVDGCIEVAMHLTDLLTQLRPPRLG
jgi:hypothetical protein